MNIKLKNNLIKIISGIFVFCLLGLGVSIVAVDDISSAHSNFSVVGIVSSINEEGMVIDQAQGSDKSGKTSYELNTKNLEKIETNKYIPITSNDVKVGDKIIAQGLTNGSTFFIKRIISFADIAVSTSTDQTPSMSSGSENIISTSSDNVITPLIIEDVTSTTISTTTSTTTEDILATSTESATTTDTVIDKAVDIVQEVIEKIQDTVTDIINNDNASTTTE